MDTKIKIPQALKAKVMLWTDVSCHDIEKIDNMHSIPDLERCLSLFMARNIYLYSIVLSSVLGVDFPEPKRGVLLELYVQTVLFCRKCSFKQEQTSALLSIIKSIHEANIQTPLNNIEQCFKYCKELLLCHSVRRPPFSINLFSSKEVDCIFKYIHNSYMRHYKLYKYIFTPQVKLDLSFTYSGVPDHEDSSAPDKGAEALPKTDGSPAKQQTSVTDQEETTLGPKSELKALIEKEVREQMMLVSGQLDQRMKEIADQHSRVLGSPQQNHKAKK